MNATNIMKVSALPSNECIVLCSVCGKRGYNVDAQYLRLHILKQIAEKNIA